ncbi:MAG TPA: AroM family protein [Rhodopila sp.]|uniref:AroM family protein n=1 Tax=Rhodopila sp. TaxID=2480087 RepID=UPI002B714C7D|nr:AroM family protein [Rhodopila sp.]HVY15485.1 AroM family protein [Rhodopila sp.]
MTPMRVAFVTIGQAPRDDVVPELLSLLTAGPDDVEPAQFGALDGLTEAEIAAPAARESRLYTRLATGRHVVVGAGFVARRLEPLLLRLDDCGYDLIVLITTGVFQPFRLRTLFVHGQQAVDAWIAALVMGACELGLMYPLAQQHRPFAHGTLIQNAQAVAATGEASRLDDAAAQLGQASLILMHSVGYTEAMARHVAALTGKPVVTARRIIAGAIRLHADLLHAAPARQTAAAPFQPDMLQPDMAQSDVLGDRLPDGAEQLTPREQEVLAAALRGEGNKVIGRRLGISHRTVEVHRARALSKLNAASPTEVIRRMLIMGNR